ncbi:hypothetical protein DZF91_28835 [Actinomadura logoneensis]|uniref:Uncharacterized protein n=1 Tax=Actinomadura logoneensis TaxID=2293572 RepID=A0A372JDZ2_9ACTN|nr:DUF5565 family protein [Actinomadura logoneensis]RFU38217.1 hypothetical protein DZF91_28835 [Actinomadura logoneensis]
MRKIPTVFTRDWAGDPKRVTRVPDPECTWVLAGLGVATRKFDGTCVRFDGERWWARREVRAGRTAPDGFVAVDADEVTGKTVGWEPAESSAFWKYLRAAAGDAAWEAGTYELIGPKVNGNPEGVGTHTLVPHGGERLDGVPRDFDGLREWLLAHPYEGIVWHAPDGRMAKLKRRDMPS